MKKSLETKNQRFKRVASRRVGQILQGLRLLSNCSNKQTYEYSDEDVKKIFSAVESEFRKAKTAFESGKSGPVEFKL